MLNKRKTVESFFNWSLTLKDYIHIGNFSGSIMGDQIVGPDFAVNMINHSCMVLHFK